MSKKQKIYYPIDKHTKEVLVPVKADYRGGLYHISKDALEVAPLPEKDGFVVVACEFDETGKPHSTKYLEDHRWKTIYSKTDCTQFKEVKELGPIPDGFTLKEPATPHDEWIDEGWVTNKSNKYITDFNRVDEVRRGLYARVCDPLIAEANIKRLMGYEQEAADMETQALAARSCIQMDNPWPELLI